MYCAQSLVGIPYPSFRKNGTSNFIQLINEKSDIKNETTGLTTVKAFMNWKTGKRTLSFLANNYFFIIKKCLILILRIAKACVHTAAAYVGISQNTPFAHTPPRSIFSCFFCFFWGGGLGMVYLGREPHLCHNVSTAFNTAGQMGRL